MTPSRPLLACLFATLLPFATVSVAASETVKKSSKTTTAKKAKPSNNSKLATQEAQAKSAQPEAVAKAITPSPAAEKAAVAATVPAAAPAVAATPALTTATKAAAPTAGTPYAVSVRQSPSTTNPYLAYRYQSAPAAAPAPTPSQQAVPTSGNPYLSNQQQFAPANPWNSVSQSLNAVKLALPGLPGGGGELSILPKIKTVYPTGEKPLKVLTFKCPTELIGITPPPVKLLHEGVNLAMDGINRSNLLPFNMQQVCM